ncbi:MAG: DUF86 domain-containing protein [Methanocorpusculum sp.]|nr:DUF86 domain-containing protein [Methanocorpusculum sp.]MBQ9831340.1 DUF86 domain-containing protein [Methanocorpusculum sp.]
MKHDVIFLTHILTRCRKILSVTEVMTYEEFADNQDVQDIVIRSFEIIGEATTHISDEFKNCHSEVPWREMKQFRNVLIHQYFRLDVKQVWAVSRNDIPEIAGLIEKLLE